IVSPPATPLLSTAAPVIVIDPLARLPEVVKIKNCPGADGWDVKVYGAPLTAVAVLSDVAVWLVVITGLFETHVYGNHKELGYRDPSNLSILTNLSSCWMRMFLKAM